MSEVQIVEKALQDFQDSWGSKITELDGKVRDLAQKTAPGWAGDGPVSRGLGAPFRKSVGEAAIESQQVKELLAGQAKTAKVTLEADFAVKSTITGDTGSPASPGDVFSQPNRYPDISRNGVRTLRVRDLLPIMTATSNRVSATVEGSVAGVAPAGQTAEGAQKALSQFVFDLKTFDVITISHLVKASEQVLADAPVLARFLNERMAHFVLRAEEHGILRGDGTPGNLSGFTAVGNHTPFVPGTGDSAIDTLRRAAATVQAADYYPSGIILHPQTWAALELAKEADDSEAYVLGNGGAAAFVADGMVPRLWGLPVVTSVSMEQNKFILADFNAACTHWVREGVTVELGFVDDDFRRNLVAIRAEMRCALAIHQPAAVRYGDLTL